MLNLFRKLKLHNHINKARLYIKDEYKYVHGIRYSKQNSNKKTESLSTDDTPEINNIEKTPEYDISAGELKNSIQKSNSEENYDVSAITSLLRNYSDSDNPTEIIRSLEKTVTQTFVDRLLYLIDKKGVPDSAIYRAAHIDRRLFSKLASNRDYKPSKDTAIALSLALNLSLNEANDILSRAGYTLAHCDVRDVIIEYFFREKIYNIADANCILHSLGQKIIGRT